MPRAIIVSNGCMNNYAFYKSELRSDDYVICADGAVKHILNIGRLPDLWVGDFDSCKFDELLENNPNLNSVEIIKLNPDKDVTDTHYCLDCAIQRGYTDIVLWGSLGGRIDHMLSNIHMLEYLSKKSVSAVIEDEKNRIYYISDTITLSKSHKYVSVIPLSEYIIISSGEGFLYSVNGIKLPREISMGVSNEIVTDNAVITLSEGCALLVESDD